MNDVNHLDPIPGPPIPFRRNGNVWSLGNRPTRLAAEVVETESGERQITIFDPVTWEVVEEEAA